jgi:Zn-dependent peptidase ImmA (M78 family)
MKVQPPSDAALDAARRALALGDVRNPADIQLEAIAGRMGAVVLYERLSTADAWLLRAEGRAIVCVDERIRGTPRAVFTIAHELGHYALHARVDHFDHCHAGSEARSDEAQWIETEADQFGTELTMPEHLAAPLCRAERPTLDDVERVARTFGTSFTASAIRYVELARAPCAVALTRKGRVRWAPESPYFPGTIAPARCVHPESAAARIPKRRAMGSAPIEVPGAAWGAREPLLEHAIPLGEAGVLSWIVAT